MATKLDAGEHFDVGLGEIVVFGELDQAGGPSLLGLDGDRSPKEVGDCDPEGCGDLVERVS